MYNQFIVLRKIAVTIAQCERAFSEYTVTIPVVFDFATCIVRTPRKVTHWGYTVTQIKRLTIDSHPSALPCVFSLSKKKLFFNGDCFLMGSRTLCGSYIKHFCRQDERKMTKNRGRRKQLRSRLHWATAMTLALVDIAKNGYATHFIAMSAKFFAPLMLTPSPRAQCKRNLTPLPRMLDPNFTKNFETSNVN